MTGNLVITKLEVSEQTVKTNEKIIIKVYAKEKRDLPINQRLPFNLGRKPRL